MNKKETPFKAGSNVVLRVKLLVYASCNFLFLGFSYDAPFTDWRWCLLPRDGSTSPSLLLVPVLCFMTSCLDCVTMPRDVIMSPFSLSFVPQYLLRRCHEVSRVPPASLFRLPTPAPSSASWRLAYILIFPALIFSAP